MSSPYSVIFELSGCSGVTSHGEFSALIPRSSVGKVEKTVELIPTLVAPVGIGQNVGTVKYSVGGVPLGETAVLTTEAVSKLDFFDVYVRILAKMSLK